MRLMGRGNVAASKAEQGGATKAGANQVHPADSCIGALLCRGCAASLLGAHPDTFDRHVRPELSRAMLGADPRWAREDIERWWRSHREATSWSDNEHSAQ